MPEEKDDIQEPVVPHWYDFFTKFMKKNKNLAIIASFCTAMGIGVDEVRHYLIGEDVPSRQEVEQKLDSVATMYGDSVHNLRVDLYRLKKAHLGFKKEYNLGIRKGNETFAVGLRADAYGNYWYRTSTGHMYRAFKNYEHSKYIYTDSLGRSRFTDFED